MSMNNFRMEESYEELTFPRRQSQGYIFLKPCLNDCMCVYMDVYDTQAHIPESLLVLCIKLLHCKVIV